MFHINIKEMYNCAKMTQDDVGFPKAGRTMGEMDML